MAVDIDKQTQKTFYLITISGLLFGISVLVIVSLLNINIEEFLYTVFPPCGIRETLGFYCPGCGGVRAFVFLMQGDIQNSILYNPFLLYAVIIIGVFFISYTLSILTKEKVKPFNLKPLYFYIGVAILLGQWIIKNILLLCFSIPLIPF